MIEFAPDLQTVEPVVVTSSIEVFASIREKSATPLLGTEDDTLLAAGGTLMAFGEGGAGKTTAELDLAFHMAAGIPWLGQPVPARVRGLILEAEGPRGKLRTKLAAKLAAWQGPSVDGWLHVIERPWATLSLADAEHRAGIAAAIADTRAEVLYAGPVAALGLEGGGTPAEVRQFVAHLEHIRALVGRDVAYMLIAHTNKLGGVSGAWEGATDTLAHFMATGNGTTRLNWKKCRWSGTVHGTTWRLLWRDGETFELEDAPSVTADTFRADILAAVAENPGQSWTKVREHVKGNATEAAAVRDRLIADGEVNNTGGKGQFCLWIAEDPGTGHQETRSDAGTGMERGTFHLPEPGEEPTRSPVPALKERGTGTARRNGDHEAAEIAYLESLAATQLHDNEEPFA